MRSVIWSTAVPAVGAAFAASLVGSDRLGFGVRLSPLLAGGVLVVGCLTVLVSTVVLEGREKARR
jgi:hypothetical protein